MSVVEAAEGGINGILGKVFWSVEELPEQHNGKILETATMEYSKCLKTPLKRHGSIQKSKMSILLTHRKDIPENLP